MSSPKLKYFSYHLAISSLIVILISMLCQFYWFPTPLLLLDGTWIALLTLAIVDIIIGPLLTLILVSSKKSKRELWIDMIMILSIQVSALSYGLIKIEQERVWAMVHLDGMFNLVPKKEVSKKYLDVPQAMPQYKGIYYTMVLNAEIGMHSQISNTPLMYSPERFHKLNRKDILPTSIQYAKLPKDIKVRYDQQYVFKFLAGKKRNAIIILSSNLTIIDIMLISDKDSRLVSPM
jgi:hypothetical protein